MTIRTRCFRALLLFSILTLPLLCLAQETRPQPVNPDDSISVPTTSKEKPIEGTEIIVVTGTYEPLNLESIDRSVSVLTTQDAPLLYNHWVDYLQMDSSVDLRQRAPNDVQADISIRGSAFGETLTLLNGLRMNDVQSGHHDLDLPLPPASLDRIEVLRGAGSTLYGSDALAGAINFITSPPVSTELRVAAGIGNFGINEENASASLLANKWSEGLGVARDFSSGFMTDRDYRSLTIFSQTDATTKLGHTTVMLAYGDKPYGANQFYGAFNSWERTKTWFAGLKQDLGTRSEFDVGYRRHSDEFILLRDQPQVYENNHITENWQASLRRKQPLRKNVTLFFGGEGDTDSIASNNLGQHSRYRGAGYVNVDMRAMERFSLSIGAREEIFDSGRTEFNPTIAGGLLLKPGWKLKASTGRAFRLPSYTDLYYRDPGNVGNPNLKPESAWSYEGGLEWNRTGRFKASITAFQMREQNVIDYVLFADNLYHAANIQRLNFTGVETSTELRLSDVQKITIGYTGIHGAQQSLNGLASRYVFNYPTSRGLVAWQGSLPGGILARTLVGVTQRYARNPYAVWDAAFAREFGALGVRASFSNLTGTRYQEIQGVAMPGRSMVFGFEYSIVTTRSNP